MELQHHQWIAIEEVFGFSTCKRGRRQKDMRGVMNGVLWVIRTREPWANIPRHFAPYSSCHQCYKKLVNTGKLETILWILALQLKDKEIDILYMFDNGRFNRNADRLHLLIEMNKVCKKQGWEWQTLQIFLNPFMETTLGEDNRKQEIIMMPRKPK